MTKASCAPGEVERLCKSVFLAGHHEGWTGNQCRRDVQHVDADKGWSLYVSNGALAKSVEAAALSPQRLDAATVERCAQAWSTIKREFGYLFMDGVEETYPEVRYLDEGIRALANLYDEAAPTERLSQRQLAMKFVRLRASERQDIAKAMGIPLAGQGTSLERDKEFIRAVFDVGREDDLARALATEPHQHGGKEA